MRTFGVVTIILVTRWDVGTRAAPGWPEPPAKLGRCHRRRPSRSRGILPGQPAGRVETPQEGRCRVGWMPGECCAAHAGPPASASRYRRQPLLSPAGYGFVGPGPPAGPPAPLSRARGGLALPLP